MQSVGINPVNPPCHPPEKLAGSAVVHGPLLKIFARIVPRRRPLFYPGNAVRLSAWIPIFRPDGATEWKIRPSTNCAQHWPNWILLTMNTRTHGFQMRTNGRWMFMRAGWSSSVTSLKTFASGGMSRVTRPSLFGCCYNRGKERKSAGNYLPDRLSDI